MQVIDLNTYTEHVVLHTYAQLHVQHMGDTLRAVQDNSATDIKT